MQKFILSFYYDNESLLRLWLCLYHLAFRQIDTGKIIFLIGEGGAGKGEGVGNRGQDEKCKGGRGEQE